MTALEASPVNLTATVGLKPVCIDNEEVRERILKASKIDVSSVPCVLIVYRTGGVEKYEGQGAFQWIEETVRKYIPPSPPDLSVQSTSNRSSRNSRNSRNGRNGRSRSRSRNSRSRRSRPEPEYEEEYDSSEEDYIPPKSHKRRYPPPQKLKLRRSPRKSSSQVSATALEDLDDPTDDQKDSGHYQEESGHYQEESSYDQEDLSRPLVAVRTGPGGYDMTSDFGEPQEQNRNMSRHTRESTKPVVGQSNDLMSAAMAMQKERESTDSKAPRSVGDPPTQRPPDAKNGGGRNF